MSAYLLASTALSLINLQNTNKDMARVQVLPLVQSAVACRLELHASMPGNKDLLYLDLALENVVRAAVERGIGSLGIGAAAFVGPLLQNLVRPLTFPQSPKFDLDR